MIDALVKYTEHGDFIFKSNDKLAKVCKDVPSSKSGVYLVYAVSNNKEELIYIGRTGQLLYGYAKHRKGGLKGHFTTGKQQLGYEVPNLRQVSWPKKMKEEEIDYLKVEWFVTLDETNNDCPMELEKSLLNSYKESNGTLPRWNLFE